MRDWFLDVADLIIDNIFSVLFTLVFVGACAVFCIGVYNDVQDQKLFKRECVSVGGRYDTDSDGDLECYKNDREIAEYGETSPLNYQR